MYPHTIHVAAETASDDLSGIWESIALVSALSIGGVVMTWRRKTKRGKATTHWAVLLSAHGGLVIVLHVGQVVAHLGGALVLTAMAERVIWDAADGMAERIDRFVARHAETPPSGEELWPEESLASPDR
jgi:hypothetical protein